MKRLLAVIIAAAVAAALCGCGAEKGDVVVSDGDPSATVTADGGLTGQKTISADGETLAEFLGADENVFNKDNIKELQVYVNHCEYGEPTQIITDETVIKAACEAALAMSVTGKADSISSTGTSVSYVFADGEQVLASFTIQDGLLAESDGRYSLEGLDALFAVEGIMLPEDFEAYYEEQSAAVEDASFNAEAGAFPASVFEVKGYYGLDYEQSYTPDCEPGITAYIDWADIETLRTGGSDLGNRVYEALCEIKVTGVADSKTSEALPSPDRFRIMISWYGEGDTLPHEVSFSFWNNTFSEDDTDYIIEGTEKLYAIPEFSEFVEYMKNYVK